MWSNHDYVTIFWDAKVSYGHSACSHVTCLSRSGQAVEMNTVTVYDIQNKFIAYSAPFPAVIGVFCEWGSLYVLAGDRKVS